MTLGEASVVAVSYSDADVETVAQKLQQDVQTAAKKLLGDNLM